MVAKWNSIKNLCHKPWTAHTGVLRDVCLLVNGPATLEAILGTEKRGRQLQFDTRWALKRSSAVTIQARTSAPLEVAERGLRLHGCEKTRRTDSRMRNFVFFR